MGSGRPRRLPTCPRSPDVRRRAQPDAPRAGIVGHSAPGGPPNGLSHRRARRGRLTAGPPRRRERPATRVGAFQLQGASSTTRRVVARSARSRARFSTRADEGAAFGHHGGRWVGRLPGTPGGFGDLPWAREGPVVGGRPRCSRARVVPTGAVAPGVGDWDAPTGAPP